MRENKKNSNQETIRLNKYIAHSGICSRRDADQYIAQGHVQVNGKVVTEMGLQVSDKDQVKFKGKPINPEKPTYLLLNKPKDYITTTSDPQGRRTVMDLIRNACEERVFPIGRLDRNTSGLLLFTNDGDLAKKLSHPSHNIRKIYQVEIDKPLTEGDFKSISEGIMLEDGEIRVDEIAVLDNERKNIGLEIHSGRNRIVRRIFEHFGYNVKKLDRVMYGPLTKSNLPRGRYRFLMPKEVSQLKRL